MNSKYENTDKVQICRYISAEEYPTNDDIEIGILDAIKSLIPYYDYVLGKDETVNKLEESGYSRTSHRNV